MTCQTVSYNRWYTALGPKPSKDNRANLKVLMESVEDDDSDKEGDDTEGDIESAKDESLLCSVPDHITYTFITLFSATEALHKITGDIKQYRVA